MKTPVLKQGSVPTRTDLRGLMLDAARLVESPDYYRRFLDFCADWGVNAVILRLTDDQGCALRFRSHPELVTHPNALTPEEAAALARYAADRGVELIPEIESLGHSHYVTRSPEHADLDDQAPDGHSWANALIPLHPKTMRILGDLYTEAAALFPGRYLHAGCDETNWGGSDFSQELLKTRTPAQVWGEYLNALNATVRGLGREMIVWDDMVLQHEPAILDGLDRSIILHDWEYAGTDPTPVAARLALAREKGFRMIGGPALHWCKWGPRAGTAQLANIDAFADVFRTGGAEASLGVITTNWLSSRYLRDAVWDGLAYAAVAMNEGGAAARATAFQRFVEQHYGTEWNEAWAGVFTTLYAAAPNRQGDTPVRLLVPWANAEELQQAIAAAPLPRKPFAGLLDTLDLLQPAIRRNHADFAAFRLTVAYLAHLYWRQAAVCGISDEALPAALAEVARRDAALAAQLTDDWHATRAGDPLAGHDQLATWGFGPEDWLHGRFLAVTQFTWEHA
jgi:hypothetical protein